MKRSFRKVPIGILRGGYLFGGSPIFIIFNNSLNELTCLKETGAYHKKAITLANASFRSCPKNHSGSRAPAGKSAGWRSEIDKGSGRLSWIRGRTYLGQCIFQTLSGDG